ncbi:MAG: copper oxidase, partial [Ferruginibacter sp.]
WDFRTVKNYVTEKDVFGNIYNSNDRRAFCLGIQYTLPLLVIADARFDTEGNFRFQLSREDVPVSKRLRFNFMANTNKEYAMGIRYVITKYISASSHYDSDMGLGIGVTFTY